MKKIKTFIFIFILLVNTAVISGCWNYVELNDITIVTGAAVDYDEKEDMIILTTEIIYPRVGIEETEFVTQVITEKGKNFFDAIRNLIVIPGKRLNWSHAKVIIISEEVAKKKDIFISIIDFIKRDAEFRDDVWLVLSREKTAAEILKTERKIQDIVSFELEDIFKNEGSVSKYHGVPLWKFVDDLSAEGISPTLPTVKAISEEKKKGNTVYGTGVFKGIKLVGWLNGSETKAFLFVIDELKGGILIIEEKTSNKPVKVALEIFKNKTKVEPVYSNGKLTMKIDIKTTTNINELESEINFINEKGREKLKKDAEKLIENRVKDVIKKVQKEYKSDILGFASIIEREMPDLWKEIKKDWDHVFTDIDIKVNATVEIRGSALRSKPIKVGD